MTTDTIDITSLKETGAELIQAIVNAVKDTQAVIIRDLPDKLIMTKAQYNELEHDPQMKGMYQSNQRVWLTWDPVTRDNLNAMEVIIKD